MNGAARALSLSLRASHALYDSSSLRASLVKIVQTLTAGVRGLEDAFEQETPPTSAIKLAPMDRGPAPYLLEVRDQLDNLSSLATATLRHLCLQDMQVFNADRDSPLLRRLARLNLLHPMGSSAYPVDAYPYRVPDVVWRELNRRYKPGVDVSPEAASQR